MSRDDKNKIKIGAPGELLALAHRKRKVVVPRNIVFEVSDHNICKKTHLIPSVIAVHKCLSNKSSSLNNYNDYETIIILKKGTIYPSNAF